MVLCYVFFFLLFEGAKLLAASMSAVEWYKSCAHISSFLSKAIHIPVCASST